MANLVFRPFEPWVSFSYHLLYPAHRARSRATEEFSQLLKQELALLVKRSNGLLRLRDHA
ncbi:hypothetical protein [Oceanisphaera psychrotolerans]|uniref:hypothetical protein n=1 Tax=Oceanisphaera psychrotolerans TaxID=1414654 RepID=UPI00111333D0|nr:hypothetical protein [Oceanisphaera psychrotolerans]